jgi:diadenosine tetraphosphate (Ap4A) HIT family hydrolase
LESFDLLPPYILVVPAIDHSVHFATISAPEQAASFNSLAEKYVS